MHRLRKMAIHEASHAIIARLFQDYLDLKQVTICRKMLTGETDPEKIDVANSGNLKRYDSEAFMGIRHYLARGDCRTKYRYGR